TDRSTFLQLLRRFVDNLHQVHICTLDSFIVSVARTFPAELGIPQQFEVLDGKESAAQLLQREALARIFDPQRFDEKYRREFCEAFKQATYGSEEKRIDELLSKFVLTNWKYYRMLPLQAAWGTQAAIWSEDPYRSGKNCNALEAAERISQWLENSITDSRFKKTMLEIVRFAANCTPASVPNSKVRGALFSRLLQKLSELQSGECQIEYHRKTYRLGRQECQALFCLMARVMATAIERSMEQTVGLYRILERYDRIYQNLTRERAAFTFSDLQALLTSANPFSSGSKLSRERTGENRLYIDYRLNCRLDHWLLDEFQDTSDLQWAALGNLADEILQDQSGERSFFYVGDVKQAIYGWRESNRKLFDAILRRYGDRIATEPLNTSFRSCQAVIDTVNQVFGSIKPGDLVNRKDRRQPEESDLSDSFDFEESVAAEVVAEWSKVWQPHTCAKGSVPDDGGVVMLAPAQIEDMEENTARYGVVVALLKEIAPIERGLSTAILVRDNRTGKEIVNTLRRECLDLAVTHEGPAAIVDNPVVQALYSLIKLGAHPADLLAWRHLQMTPLGSEFRNRQLSREEVSLLVLRLIHERGFRSVVEEFGQRLAAWQPLDEFGWQRLADLRNAASDFDLTGNRNADDFLRFLEGCEIREVAAANSVRVMTIHQAKGLGFDVVILPSFEVRAGAGHAQPLVCYDPVTQVPRWILKMPPREIAQADPTLARVLRRQEADEKFEELCVLYVAMTRAKRALYVVGRSSPRNEKFSADRFLKKRLVPEEDWEGRRIRIAECECLCLYEHGNPRWYEAIPKAREGRSEPTVTPELSQFRQRASRRKELMLVRPAEQEVSLRSASWLFETERQKAIAYGNAIHSLFRRVEWIENLDLEGVIADWRQEWRSADEELIRAVSAEFRNAVAAAEVRAALGQPTKEAELWREQAFEVVIGHTLVSGVFDRVTILRDALGEVVGVEVLDYKSDRVRDEADLRALVEQYRPQLELYGRAVSRILGISPRRVHAAILFTGLGQVVRLRPSPGS
ncbi:MAG: UvrD-helicase domain-containing protein, partial [Kiritimatiellia bacterium]